MNRKLKIIIMKKHKIEIIEKGMELNNKDMLNVLGGYSGRELCPKFCFIYIPCNCKGGEAGAYSTNAIPTINKINY